MDAPPIELACLDLAGTTVADDGAVESAFRTAAEGFDLDPDAALARVRMTMGMSKIVVFRDLLGDEEPAQEANRRFEAAYADVVESGGATPLPGAEDTIAALRDSGVKVCLTTGFSAATRDAVLDAVGWRDSVDLALSPGDAVGGRGRPHPDMVLTAVLRLGVTDVRAVAVAGDTTNDLWSGWRAGASIVAGVLTGAHDRATLAEAPHTHLLESVAELPAVVSATSPSRSAH
jgi:phosphonatase-like hydrolase